MKTSIGLKIGAGYALATLALILIGAVSYFSVTHLIDAAHKVEHSHEVIEEIQSVLSDIVDIETGMRGYAITQNESFLENYHVSLGDIQKDLSRLRTLLADPIQRQLIDRLEPMVAARVAFAQEIVELIKRKDQTTAVERISLGDGKKLMDEVRGVSREMMDREKSVLKERSEESSANARSTILTIVMGVSCVSVVIAAIGFFTVRNIAGPLRQITGAAERIASGDLNVITTAGDRGDEVGVLAYAFSRMVGSLQATAKTAQDVAAGNLAVTVKPQSEKDVVGNALATMVHQLSALIGQVQRSGIQVNTSATQIAATATEQQAMSGQISSTTAEISTTAREISATSQELVKAMQEVASGAEESARLAGSSHTGLTRMDEIMRQIMTASGAINTRLGVLSEKSGNINAVVTTISKVADQTNLLSLNAAIEAEKAGEQGRGFAVVATEIRRLADQTAVATLDIEQIVKEMQSAVSAGVMGMEKFSEEVRRGVEVIGQVGGQLTQIIEQVQASTPSIEAVNEGMQSQSQGAQQISDALVQLGEAAHQTAESLRQSNEVITQLNEATQGLQNGVARFQVKS